MREYGFPVEVVATAGARENILDDVRECVPNLNQYRKEAAIP
jgi:hypothetical protein